jgi:N-acetylmuramoyl-L-alanine amidase
LKPSGKILLLVPGIIILASTALASRRLVSIPVISHAGKEYISLFSAVEALELDNTYDIITRRGRLFRHAGVAVYQVGMSTVLANGRLRKYAYAVTGRDGEIMFPVRAGIDIFEEFYAEATVTREGNRIIIAIPGAGEAREDPPAIVTKRKDSGPSRDRISFIIIDPGHGGKDPGAVGKGGSKEKWITLSIAQKLEKYFNTHLKGVKTVLTRKSDRFIELSKRTDIANSHLKQNENGIFISLHVNASISPRISGFETYFLSQNASNEEARATAALENNVIILEDKSSKKSYDDVEHIEAFMYTAQILKESSLLAESIQSGMDRTIREFKSRSVRKADFFVLRGSLMPAVLVEVGYITNEKESAAMRKSEHQDAIVKGIGSGTMSFLKKYNEMIKK